MKFIKILILRRACFVFTKFKRFLKFIMKFETKIVSFAYQQKPTENCSFFFSKNRFDGRFLVVMNYLVFVVKIKKVYYFTTNFVTVFFLIVSLDKFKNT